MIHGSPIEKEMKGKRKNKKLKSRGSKESPNCGSAPTSSITDYIGFKNTVHRMFDEKLLIWQGYKKKFLNNLP